MVEHELFVHSAHCSKDRSPQASQVVPAMAPQDELSEAVKTQTFGFAEKVPLLLNH
jgi:hypothetical protein